MAKEILRSDIDSLLGGSVENMKTPEKESRPASEGAVKYYLDLCSQKNITPEEKTFTATEIDAEIKRLKEMKAYVPASPKQIESITKLTSMMNMPLPDFSKLDGTYGGTASQLIQKLQTMSKNVVLPITEEMVKFISSMQYCPDCDEVDVASMTKNEAHEYINKFKGKFYAWKKDRLTDKQMLNIVRLNCLIEGAEVSDVLDRADLTVTQKVGELIGRQSLEFSTLILYDQNLATKYIEELETELVKAEWKETTLEPEVNTGYEKTPETTEELRNLVAKLYASIGQELEEEFYENMTWDSLKELVDFVKLFGVDVNGILDRITIFDSKQKALLTA